MLSVLELEFTLKCGQSDLLLLTVRKQQGELNHSVMPDWAVIGLGQLGLYPHCYNPGHGVESNKVIPKHNAPHSSIINFTSLTES